MIGAQFLEGSSSCREWPSASSVERKLEDVFEKLPLDILAVGWDLPDYLYEVSLEVASRYKCETYLWHPLLTMNGLPPQAPLWGVEVPAPLAGALGQDQEIPGFSFVCPNRPEAREAVIERLCRSYDRHGFDGVFLDRIRYPSPASGIAVLSCFCPACRKKALQYGLDLEAVARRLADAYRGDAQNSADRMALRLADMVFKGLDRQDDGLLEDFLAFRMRCISEVVAQAGREIRSRGGRVGLDCFSPLIAPIVGQDLVALREMSDWIKIMTYCHARGPAGLPYEVYHIARLSGLEWSELQPVLSRIMGVTLPDSAGGLLADGLPYDLIGREVASLKNRLKGGESEEEPGEDPRKGPSRFCARPRIFAGIEAVSVPGVIETSPKQVRVMTTRAAAAGADGIILSWDIAKTPQDIIDELAGYGG